MNDRSFYPKAFGWIALALVASVALLYPHFCDGIDPDGTSYFTLARRWANGDFARAVNGYWSPFSIWLTALGMRLGLEEVPAVFLQNIVAAIAFLGASLALLQRYAVSQKLLRWTLPALAFFLLHAVFHQWFSDLWGAAFALLALRVLLIDDFFQKPLLWLCYGLLGALAYVSKSLYLPWWAVQTLLAVLLCPGVALGRRILVPAVAFGVLAALCWPWWTALWAHYGFWTTGVAGPLNLSWGVVGHAIFTPAGGAFLPPLHPDSISYWEDPWWANARLVHFWDSPQQFLKMLPRFGYFVLRLLQKSALLSVFLPIAYWYIAQGLWANRFRLAGDFKTRLLQAALLIFPLPFVMLHSEVRYLWFLAPLVLIWVQCFLLDKHFNRFVAGSLAASLCLYGLFDFGKLWHMGRKERAFAQQLKAQGVSGDFVADSGITYGEALRVAYFSGLRYWPPKGENPPTGPALQTAAQRVGIHAALRRSEAGFEWVRF